MEKIAELAYLNLPKEDVERSYADVMGIVSWIGQLRNVETTGIKPMFTPLQQHGITSPLRKDEVGAGGDAKRVLQNAKRKEGNYFVAPKMVDHDVN